MARETILIVEDETITALDIQRCLRAKGYSVAGIAFTGPEAISLARQNSPDLVLMDIRLNGEMDGITAARQIRQEHNAAVVFLTANADSATLERAKTAQPEAYLLKPFEETILAKTIEITLDNGRVHELLLTPPDQPRPATGRKAEAPPESSSGCALLMLDAAGQILSWSLGAEKLHGWTAAEALGKHFSLLYPPEDAKQRKPDADLNAATRAGRFSELGPQARKNESRFPAQMLLLPLRNGTGSLAGFLKFTREVSPGTAEQRLLSPRPSERGA